MHHPALVREEDFLSDKSRVVSEEYRDHSYYYLAGRYAGRLRGGLAEVKRILQEKNYLLLPALRKMQQLSESGGRDIGFMKELVYLHPPLGEEDQEGERGQGCRAGDRSVSGLSGSRRHPQRGAPGLPGVWAGVVQALSLGQSHSSLQVNRHQVLRMKPSDFMVEFLPSPDIFLKKCNFKIVKLLPIYIAQHPPISSAFQV